MQLDVMLRELASPVLSKRDAAQSYSLLLTSPDRGLFDFDLVHYAIAQRWGEGAVDEVREMARLGTCWWDHKGKGGNQKQKSRTNNTNKLVKRMQAAIDQRRADRDPRLCRDCSRLAVADKRYCQPCLDKIREKVARNKARKAA